MGKNVSVNWKELEGFAARGDIVLSLDDLSLVPKCKELGIKFYWTYPICSYYELEGIVALQPAYVYLGVPLCFDLQEVNKRGIPIRLCPNVAYEEYIPRADGIQGSWIRPEDVENYGQFVDALDFHTDNLKSEASLFHIFAENKTWPGNLNLIIKNLNFDIDNRIISEELGVKRMNCGQRCMRGGRCNICNAEFKHVATLRHIYYQRKIKEKN